MANLFSITVRPWDNMVYCHFTKINLFFTDITTSVVFIINSLSFSVFFKLARGHKIILYKVRDKITIVRYPRLLLQEVFESVNF